VGKKIKEALLGTLLPKKEEVGGRTQGHWDRASKSFMREKGMGGKEKALPGFVSRRG